MQLSSIIRYTSQINFFNTDKCPTLQTFTRQLESHWVPYLYGLVSHLSKKLSKLQLFLSSIFVDKGMTSSFCREYDQREEID